MKGIVCTTKGLGMLISINIFGRAEGKGGLVVVLRVNVRIVIDWEQSSVARTQGSALINMTSALPTKFILISHSNPSIAYAILFIAT